MNKNNNNNTPVSLERCLTRQLKSSDLNLDEMPTNIEEWRSFVYSVNRNIIANKETRYVLERSLDESTQEMRKLYDDLKDETELRVKALQESDEKTRFLANMSHEIRTPINGVLGSLEIVKNNTILNPQQRQFVGAAYTSAEDLLGIINNILDFSKISAKQLELENITFDVYQLVEDVTNIAAVSASDKSLNVSWSIQKEVPTRVKGDPTKIRQILTNFLNNAIKFTPRGEITTRVSLLQEDAKRCMLRFEVTDTGVGIPQDMQQNIFDAFIQEDASTTRQYGGTGLGLAIIKELTQLMGGQTYVQSRKGQGSSFGVDVPFDNLAEESSETVEKNLVGLRVLAVDDDKANLKNIEHYLTQWNMQIDTAYSGSEGIEYLYTSVENELPYDVLIVDSFLSDIGGLKFSQAINTNADFRQIPKITLKSTSAAREVQLNSSDGLSVTKPIRKIMLKNTLLECLNLQQVAKGTYYKNDDETIKKVSNDLPNRIDILLAEDNEVNALIAIALMKQMGLTVKHVTNGQQAFEEVKAGNFKVVLMDMHMPVMDGYHATQRIREWEVESNKADSTRIPIIALTANALTGDREKCLSVGMNDYLSKPVRQNHLMDVVSKWIKAKEPALV